MRFDDVVPEPPHATQRSVSEPHGGVGGQPARTRRPSGLPCAVASAELPCGRFPQRGTGRHGPLANVMTQGQPPIRALRAPS